MKKNGVSSILFFSLLTVVLCNNIRSAEELKTATSHVKSDKYNILLQKHRALLEEKENLECKYQKSRKTRKKLRDENKKLQSDNRGLLDTKDEYAKKLAISHRNLDKSQRQCLAYWRKIKDETIRTPQPEIGLDSPNETDEIVKQKISKKKFKSASQKRCRNSH